MNTLREIHAWDEFIRAFETVFHTDWPQTAAKLPLIGSGTFFQPSDAEGTADWDNRNKLFKAYYKIRQPISLAVIEARKVEEALTANERWLTGDVVLRDEGIMFRIQDAIDGNPPGSLCLLGASRGLENYLIPQYMEDADAGTAVRLYGTFIPAPEPRRPNSPTVAFITWKRHLATDPDELPEERKLVIQPGDRMEGYVVHEISDQESLIETVLREFGKLQHHPRSCVIIMHGFIELLTNALIEEKCKNGKKISSNKRDYSHSIKLELLHELSLLEDTDFEKLSWFRKLRNDAAHEAIFDIKTKNFDLFRGERFHGASHFPQICLQIFMNLWNKNKDSFAAKFSPKGQGGEIIGSVFQGKVHKPAKP